MGLLLHFSDRFGIENGIPFGTKSNKCGNYNQNMVWNNQIQKIFLGVWANIFKSHFRASLNFNRNESHSSPIDISLSAIREYYVPRNIKGPLPPPPLLKIKGPSSTPWYHITGKCGFFEPDCFFLYRWVSECCCIRLIAVFFSRLEVLQV